MNTPALKGGSRKKTTPKETSYTKISFKLAGVVPSKKNAWHPNSHGGMYIDHDLKSELDGFLYQLITIRNRKKIVEPLIGDIRVTVKFYLREVKYDADNSFTTLLDLLQKALIIKNDKMVGHFKVDRYLLAKDPEVHVTIEGEM